MLFGADDITIDIPGGVYSDFVNYWYDQGDAMREGLSKSQMRTLAEIILPVYMYGVATGKCPEIDLESGGGGYLASANTELTAYMTDRTGLTKDTWMWPLMLLDSAVESGIVPARYMKPATWADVAPPTISERLSPFTASMTAGIGAGFTKTLITAGVVIAVVLLGKAVIDKAI
jgi:hypothetical protein